MSKGSYDIVRPTSQAIQERVATILAFASVEIILCYGVRRKQNEVWSLFKGEPQISESLDMDVLIVIHPSEKHREHELVDRVNNLNTAELRLIPVIHNAGAILDSTANGSSFFQAVLSKGVMIYQRPQFSISNFEYIPVDRTALAKHWKHRSALAHRFLSGAKFYMARTHYNLAAFMMHQSVENLCSAIIYAILGYRVTTHNLNRLLSLTENFSPAISELFTRTTQTDREVFDLLSHAYSQGRYSYSFNISKAQAKAIYDKVGSLILIVTETHTRPSQ